MIFVPALRAASMSVAVRVRRASLSLGTISTTAVWKSMTRRAHVLGSRVSLSGMADWTIARVVPGVQVGEGEHLPESVDASSAGNGRARVLDRVAESASFLSGCATVADEPRSGARLGRSSVFGDSPAIRIGIVDDCVTAIGATCRCD